MIRIPDDLFAPEDGTPPDSAEDFAAELAIARGAAALTSAEAEASKALHDLDRSFEAREDHPAGWVEIFDRETRSLRDAQASRLPDPQSQAAFARSLDDLAAAKIATLRRMATARELNDARAQLDSALGTLAAMSAEAASGIERDIIEDQAHNAIGRMAAAGFFADGEEANLRRDFLAQRDLAQLDRLIADDPAAAEAALADPERFIAVPAQTREWRRDRAVLRLEDALRSADAAARGEHEARVARLMLRLEGGEADRADIMQAQADGGLGLVERDRALALWNDRRREDEKHQADVDRVNGALSGNGPTLDPDNADDVAAVGSHFKETEATWLAAGIREDQLVPLVVDYVRRAGILPSSVRREISGAFRSGDLHAAVRAQELMAQLPPRAMAAIDQRDGAEAVLGLALQRTGWSPEQAADRAGHIMAGTIDPNDRFFEQDSAATTRVIEHAAASYVQLAALPSGTASDGAAPEITSDAPPPRNENVQVAVLPLAAMGFMFGGLALATLFAAKKASEDTRDAWDKWKRSDDHNGPPQMLPPLRPLQSQEQMPPQPSELPNIPPSVHLPNEELVPEKIEIHTLPGPPPEPAEPGIYIFTPPDFELPINLENRKGGFRSKAEIDYHRDRILDENPGWTHIAGGRNRRTGEEIEEYWHFGPGREWGDGRAGGHFADLTFRDEKGELVHIQHASVDRNGKPTAQELENARALAQPHYVDGKLERPRVYIVLKQWQMRK